MTTVNIESGSAAMPSTRTPPPEVRDKLERMERRWLAMHAQVDRLKGYVLELRLELRENNRRAMEYRTPPEGFALKRSDLERRIEQAERELAATEAEWGPLARLLSALRDHCRRNGFDPANPIPSTAFVNWKVPGSSGPVQPAPRSVVVRGA